jgi:hypothetical protein
MKRLTLVLSLVLSAAALTPTAASACRLQPLPSLEERIAVITERQANAWAASPLVYLAEVVERGVTEDGPEGFSRTNVTLAPLVVLKGENLPARLSLDLPSAYRRCGRDFLDIEDSYAAPGDRVVVYATTASPGSMDDIWTQIYGEVRDPEAIRAMARSGWLQPAPRFPYQLGN